MILKRLEYQDQSSTVTRFVLFSWNLQLPINDLLGAQNDDIGGKNGYLGGHFYLIINLLAWPDPSNSVKDNILYYDPVEGAYGVQGKSLELGIAGYFG